MKTETCEFYELTKIQVFCKLGEYKYYLKEN